MELYLMRHADAVDGNGNDFARGLSAQGRKQADKMGGWLAHMDPGELPIYSSPYPRAHETAVLVAARLDKTPGVRPDERLAAGMTAQTGAALIHELGATEGKIMLVGHAPDLGNLAAYLIGAESGAVAMKKGAVACLETSRSGFGGSILQWLITPKL